ncbi:MAG: SpoIIE family protein phosphatase [Bacteroidales bacterium]|nr:SpoIIE family protein phosphatase [Bacteroidales bacterium]
MRLLISLLTILLTSSSAIFAETSIKDCYHLQPLAYQAYLEIKNAGYNVLGISRADSLFSEGISHSDVGETAAGQYLLADVYHALGRLASADSVFYASESLLADNDDFYCALRRAYERHITVKYQMNDTDGAEAIAQALVALAQQTNDYECISTGYLQLGNIYMMRQNANMAILMFNKALDVALPNKLHYDAVNAYMNLAYCYQANMDTLRCADAIDKAVAISRKNLPTRMTSTVLINRLGLNCLKITDEEFVADVDRLIADGSLFSLLPQDGTHSFLARYYAIKKRKDDALAHADSIQNLFNRIGALEDIYIRLDDWRQAYNYAMLSASYRDSVQTAILNDELAAKDAALNNVQLRLEKEQIKMRNRLIVVCSLSAIALLIVSFVVVNGIMRRRRLQQQKRLLEDEVSKKTAELRTKNSLLEAQKEELETQKEEILAKNESLAEKNSIINQINRDMSDSIDYASNIQSAILPDLQQYVHPDGIAGIFAIFLPYKTVSGDFYWARQRHDAQIFVCADCTGHGVPGAFMSMIGSTLLNEITLADSLPSPGDILSELDSRLKYQLSQSADKEVKDGMDLSIAVYYPASRTLCLSSARRPVYLCSGGVLSEIKGSKRSIGDRDALICAADFESVTLSVNTGDSIFMCSDGFSDQFGGIKTFGGHGKRLKNSGVKLWLDDVKDLPSAEQHDILLSRLSEWKDGCEQVDDITILGIKF